MAIDREDKDAIMKVVKEIVNDTGTGEVKGLLAEYLISEKLENLSRRVDTICSYGYPNLDRIL